MRKFAVTGATGNAGIEVVRALHARGAPVVALGSSPEKLARAVPPGVETRTFDFFRPETWRPATSDCISLFLLRPPPISSVQTTLIPFAAEARRGGVAHIVFLSVAGAETNRLVPHHKVEVFLKREANHTILRPGFFAQNLQDAYLRDLREDSRLYVPAGRGRAAFVDLRDVAEVAADALMHPAPHAANGYTLTGGEALSFADAAAMLSRHLGRAIQYQAASIPGYLRHLRKRGLPWAQALVQMVLHVGLRFGQAERVDPTLARLLGRAPRTLEDYVTDHVSLWAASAPSKKDLRT